MPPATPRNPAPPPSARRFVVVLCVVAIGAVATAQIGSTEPLDGGLFAFCAALCALLSLLQGRSPAGASLQPQLPVVVFAALILPPAAIVGVVVAAFAPGGIAHRHTVWRTLGLTAALAIACSAASALAAAIGNGPDRADLSLGMFVGPLVLVVLNHALRSALRSLVNGERPRAAALAAAQLAGAFGLGLAIDLALALTGASVAAMWLAYPEALPLAIGPVALACAALWLPALRQASRTDAKTGLFNYTHARHLMSVAIAAANRSGRPASVLMVDLDHLRAVNNRHGHLKGDELIAAVAGVLADVTANRGSAGRFGGEEFCAVLPGLDAAGARAVAEEIRSRVADLHTSTGAELPAASVSIGVATCPEHGDDVDVVLHAADMALYDAKLGGRNRVRIAAPRRELPPPPPRLAEPVAVAAPAPVTAAQERSGWIAPLAALLMGATGLTVLLAQPTAISQEPLMFLALLGVVLVLDSVRIDLFKRAQTSPAALVVLVLAALFGPLGPIAAEALIAGLRLIRRVPPLKLTFDFGALSLAGLAAAIVFSALDGSGAEMIAAGMAAGMAYYAVNSLLVAIVVWLASGVRPLSNFREQLAWLAPHYVAFGALAGVFVTTWQSSGYIALALFGLPTVLLWIGEKQYVERSRAGVEDLRRSHSELERANGDLRRLLSDNQALIERLQSSYLSTVTSLARTIEAKDPYTGGHTDRVSRVAGTLAAEMGFTAAELQSIEVGAAIHDVGKIGVSDAVLLKPGPLSDEERAEIERHPEISSYIVAELDVPVIVKQMVRSHHERYDGTGYPDALIGEEIPVAARILAVADALDAMTTDRPYRKALSTAEALTAIDECVGSQFCPQVVAALHRSLQGEADAVGPPSLTADSPPPLAYTGPQMESAA